MYTYSYDPKYQLAGATWGTPSFTANTFTGSANNIFQEKNITYDFNGNITSLQRTDKTGALSDNFNNGYAYQTNTNKLNSVTNATTSTAYATYDYDELGRMKRETLTGAPNPYYLKYDVTGKITGIYSDAAMTNLQESYTYDESGNRIKTVNPNGTTYYVYDASGNVMAIYTGTTPTMSEVPVYGSSRLGTYTVSSSNYVYELRDNVGSVRVVINRTKNSSGQADMIQYNDYYPYGSIAQRGGLNTYRYDYQGAYAEKDPITGWNNFQLRMYDGKIGRWLTMDPAGQFASPYEGMGNNPVGVIDPSGGEGDSCCGVDPGTFDLLGALISFFNPPRGSTANPIALHEVSVVGYVTKKNDVTSLSSRLWQTGTDLDNLIPRGGENYQPGAYIFFNNDGHGGLSNGGHTTVGHYYGSKDITEITYLLGGTDLPSPQSVSLDLISNTQDLAKEVNGGARSKPLTSKAALQVKVRIDSNLMEIDKIMGDTVDAPTAIRRSKLGDNTIDGGRFQSVWWWELPNGFHGSKATGVSN